MQTKPEPLPMLYPRKTRQKRLTVLSEAEWPYKKTMSDITAKQDIGLVKERATERPPISPNRLV